jgi:two-component system sensor histidine kinase BarA
MTMETESHSGIDLLHADITRLEDVVDKQALAQVCRSFFDLFGISIRVFSRAGSMLSDVHEERAICRYVNSLPNGRRSCSTIVTAVKDLDPENGPIFHTCFTGAVYRVVPIEYHGRRVGRFVVGPYLPAELKEIPRSLVVLDDALDAEAARLHLAEMPRVRAETVERITAHLGGIVDLLLFSSHRAQLASEMHIASVRESYRELAEKNARLQTAYDKLKELDKLKSNFLATVSHELRTPLTSIIGYSEMLESGMAGDLGDEQKEFVETIRSKGEHLLSLITSMLDLGRLEQGSMKLKLEPLDPRALVQDVAKTLTPQAAKKNIKFSVHAAEGLGTIAADAVRLRQVLFNLTENAIKFTPDGGVVHLGATESEMESGDGGFGAVLLGAPRRAVAFTVRDTGIGMPEGELSKIFDAFYQIDGSATREHGGAGIGLSIVKRMTEMHGGEVKVKSEVGKGTTFTVEIPEPEEEVT